MHIIQEKLLEQIEQDKNFGSLTLRDMGKLINEQAPQKIKHHLSQLEKNGFINLDKKNKKIARIKGGRLKSTSSIIAVPILGYADCGDAKQVAEERPDGYLKVSSKLLKESRNIFALRAVGNSMNRAEIGKNKKSIEEGDFVIIDYKNKMPRNGDYFLSVIDGMANLKKILIDKINKQIVLLSESTQDYKPIFIHSSDDYIIGGKILQVIKKPKIK
jgi:repressor LexA